MTFDVTPDGGDPFRVVAGSRDVVTWEKSGRQRSFSQFAPGADGRPGITMTDMYSLAYVAARRQGLYPGTLQEFEQGVELTMVDDEDGQPDPTREGPSAGPS